ncbi:hypothetical protein DW091_18770 [Eubacterium sp. AM05-23]|nr:hypothetical protein DW091_18770 [Eubacterium sp. AM05-23]
MKIKKRCGLFQAVPLFKRAKRNIKNSPAPKTSTGTGAGDENLQRFKSRKSAQAIELAVGSRYNVGAKKAI